MRCFADGLATVERLLTEEARERVGVVLFDAFGRRLLERHAGHRFLRRLAGDGEPDTLTKAGLAATALLPGDTLYQRLAAAGIASTVLQPAAFSPSSSTAWRRPAGGCGRSGR